MKIHSPAFEHNGAMPRKYTCDGDNVSPPLLFITTAELIGLYSKS